MKEIVFIRQNIDKWKEVEHRLDTIETVSPEALATLYFDITADLAFAQTNYPGSKITRYLNDMAHTLHTHIYRNKREPWSRLITFWTQEVPDTVYQTRKLHLAALLLLVLSIAIGVISTLGDKQFTNLILGDDYVQMTLENIRNGNPLGVYASEDSLTSFLGITFNNVTVDVKMFASGILTCILTVLYTFYNGVMVGNFFTFMAQQGVVRETFLTVLIHGTLEISTMAISCAAGLSLGLGWILPGTYPRMVAFRRGAKRGLRMFVGVVPITILAGFLEGFITRHTHWPVAVRAGIILCSLAFVVFYYIYLPFKRNHHANPKTKD